MFGLTPFNNRKQNGIVRKNDIWDLRSVFDDFFNESVSGFLTTAHPIKADVRETEKEYIIDAEIPGVKKEDVKLEFRDNQLTILVEQNHQINEENDNYIRKERRYGSFSRSFYVENVKHEGVAAKYNDGILSITLQKEETAKNNNYQINIQ